VAPKRVATGPVRVPVVDPAFDRQVDAVITAARFLVGVVASSVAQVEDVVTLPQLRVLVMAATRGPLNVGAVADVLGVHPSNATRACDRLVGDGLLRRREDAADRRQLVLTLSPKGQRLVDGVMAHRRAAIADVLAQLPESGRRGLTLALETFSAAAAGATPPPAHEMSWFTG